MIANTPELTQWATWRALAAHAGVDAKQVAQRMMGSNDGKVMPSVERFQALIAKHQGEGPPPQDQGQPYPFFLAHQLDAPPDVPTCVALTRCFPLVPVLSHHAIT